MTETPFSGSGAAGEALRVDMLGCLTVSRNGVPLALPASRKARALLAYLALASRPTPRPKLCELLWDGPGDPRGELRWCLSKLRGVVGAARINSAEDALRLDLSNCFIDALELERAAQVGIDTLAPERARALLPLFRGDFLEGLELGCCPLSNWLLAQRRRFRAWHAALLAHLVESASDDEAFGYLDHWLELAPFDPRAHERLLVALALRGRIREGEEHLKAVVRLFTAEGLDCASLRGAWYSTRMRKPGVLRVESKCAIDADPHEYYAQGRQHLARMMRKGLETSREMFLRAIELDANYGPAWSGLAMAHAGLCEWFGAGASGRTMAEQTSRRALEVAPRLAEAHAARGLARSLSRNYDEAEREFSDAIRLNQYLFDAYYYSARTSFARGDMTRAARFFQLASDLNRQDFQSPLLCGQALRTLGREDAAREAEQAGVRRAEQALAIDPSDGRALSLAAGALHNAGQTDRALEWLARSLDLYPNDASALVNGACLYANLGDRDQALDLLGRVFAQGCGKRDWVLNDPDYAPLRKDLRFQRLLAGIS